MTFAAAQQQCADVGLELPIPGSAGEASTVNASGSVGPIWLGLTDVITDDDWLRRVFKTMIEIRFLREVRFIHFIFEINVRIWSRSISDPKLSDIGF